MPKIETTITSKVLFGVLLLLWLKHLKEGERLSKGYKLLLGLAEFAISVFVGSKDTVNLVEGVLIALPVGFELFLGLRWKPSTA
jgi:hypothetical protein